jgi:hypothetical protein
MPLKLRPTGLGSGTYKDNVDYSVFSGEWLIGRIYERNGFPRTLACVCDRKHRIRAAVGYRLRSAGPSLLLALTS